MIFSHVEKSLEFQLPKRLKLQIDIQHRKNGLRAFSMAMPQNQGTLLVQEPIFDAFRRAFGDFLANESRMPLYVGFGGENHFRLEMDRPADANPSCHIVDLHPNEWSDRLIIPEFAMTAFFESIFDDRLSHPSGCLERVMSYHSMLQLAFPQVSESLNAEMNFRQKFLSFEISAPKLSMPRAVDASSDDEAKLEGEVTSDSIAEIPVGFRSRLGVKTKSPKSVNYDALLASLGVQSESQHSDDSADLLLSKRNKGGPQEILDLGLRAADVKSATSLSVRIRPDDFDLQSLRDTMAAYQGSQEFFLGFDIVDLWFLDKQKKPRVLRFPLYFASVCLSDFGSEIEIRFENEGRFHLNFLALADAISRFSGEKSEDKETEKILTRIRGSKFEFLGDVDRVRLERRLPVADGLFAAQRRAIFGQDESGPIGGALEELRVKHVSVDAERTLLFPQNLALSESELALSKDLKTIRSDALQQTNHFSKSLVGRVFNPVRPNIDLSRAPDGEPALRRKSLPVVLPRCNPFELPDANVFLFEQFEKKDLLLVEGPPGTGKTFSMLNLLVHCVCQGKRVLVVSDKQAALDALYEKIESFLGDEVQDERELRERSLSLRAGVKKPLWSEKALSSIQDAARAMRSEIKLDLIQEVLVSRKSGRHAQILDDHHFYGELSKLDRELQVLHELMDREFAGQFGSQVHSWERVCSRNLHETTEDDIASLATFAKYLLKSPDASAAAMHEVLRNFVRNRQTIIASNYPQLKELLRPPAADGAKSHLQLLTTIQITIQSLLKKKPNDTETLLLCLDDIKNSPWRLILIELHEKAFGHNHQSASGLKRLKDRVFYPMAEDLQNLLALIQDEIALYRLNRLVAGRAANQLAKLHDFALSDPARALPCLAWAILQQSVGGDFGHAALKQSLALNGTSKRSIGEIVVQIQKVHGKRKSLVRGRFAAQLVGVFKGSGAESLQGQESDLLNELDSQFETVVHAENLAMALASFDKLKTEVARSFPVWLLRKDHVSLALPLASNLFDVVIIDEATQCRVDDAIPLMSRASKVIAVGDEHQTVLQRRSVLDDYLFGDFELEDHLHVLNATAVKAAGSHFFGLLKGLKQSRVLLDEHFRCPPEIIAYSNRYVYEGMLKVMKWQPKGALSPVVVDYSEKRTRNRNRPTRGKYKGIEIGMIDRFFDWVQESILEFEKDTGRRVNLETDVAICYFLLKNTEYVKEKKAQFLRSMKRGEDVLDGAGAALQGKERDLIFFLWDITRGNFQAFLQGDDPSKRKGELNVLMSRPRLRAYHYLHKDFSELDHSRSSITHYLWTALKDGSPSKQLSDDNHHQQSTWQRRQNRPSSSRLPWRRTDGQLLFELIRVIFASQGHERILDQFEPQFGVVVGRPENRVDLILNPRDSASRLPRIALVELSGFESLANAQEISHFASILARANPQVEAIFLNIHELFGAQSFALRRLLELMSGRS